MKKAEQEQVIADIFETARDFDGIEFLYTLLRLEGPRVDNSDRILKLKLKLDSGIDDSSSFLEQTIDEILLSDFFDLVGNLLRMTNKTSFTMFPFYDLQKGLGYEPSLVEKIRYLIRLAAAGGKTDFGELLTSTYDFVTIENLNANLPVRKAALRKLLRRCVSFAKLFLTGYHLHRLKYVGQPRFTKIPGYQVIELLVNDELGLYGFYMHFPSGGKSTCIRYPEKKEMINFTGVERVHPFVGLIPFDKEWLVNGKRLHELNLEGHYNSLGEWKPIVYPGNYEAIINEARDSSPDRDVQGSLFYVLTTGFKGIEFVVKTNIELPHQSGSIGSNLHLWKCPKINDGDMAQNFCLYDCWFELDSIEPMKIKEAIANFGIAMNRLAFAYNGKIEWRVKYRMSHVTDRILMPSDVELDILNALLQDFPDTKDAIILDSALDWFNRAKTSNNTFASFLSYYVAIENVALSIAGGKSDFGLNYAKDNRSKRKVKREQCIEAKFMELYSTNPSKFVEEAYFDCVVSLKNKTKKIIELVFGIDHPFAEKLFSKSTNDEMSLSEIRNGIAHGSISLVDRSHELLVARRLPEMATIAKEFLSRLIFAIKSHEQVPTQSVNFTAELKFADPRSTLVVRSDHDLFNPDDWKIKAEWVD
jgi:hypothetical protein